MVHGNMARKYVHPSQLSLFDKDFSVSTRILDIDKPTIYDALSYYELKRKCKVCKKCVLCEGRTRTVFGAGPTVHADMMLIGEGPGENEDKSGLPFVGRAGKLLDTMFNSVGIERRKVYITNIVKCRPPKNRTPFEKEVAACKWFLIRQIQLIQPRILMVVGNPASQLIFNNKQLRISKIRGEKYNIDVNYMKTPLVVVPLLHPAYLLRNASSERGSPKWKTWGDLKMIKELVDAGKHNLEECW